MYGILQVISKEIFYRIKRYCSLFIFFLLKHFWNQNGLKIIEIIYILSFPSNMFFFMQIHVPKLYNLLVVFAIKQYDLQGYTDISNSS